jgi:3D-(3,5/4)-trihydroxycyclohexane-1,2-dione acylhydrolase (decyclizing)
MSKTIRLTMSQAAIAFLKNQYVERDGRETQFFAGVWGIFGHGNVAGIGQALRQHPEFPYYLCRNEQAMTHTAAAYAKVKNRLQTFVCTTSIGPGATNMVTGAACATINRLPLLLLPGDIFAKRGVGPVLQQLESESTQDIGVNDVFKPVSRYWDRINRADQLPHALLEAMRVLTSPSQTGTVTLAMPQDVQTEAFDYPAALFEKRVWTIPRARVDRGLLAKAAEWIRTAKAPLIVAGGGVHYSEANEALARFAAQTGIAIGESQAGKGSLPFDHPQQLGAIGVTGTPGANIMARAADLVIGIGTRYSDFTTASKTAFQNPNVRFINLNVCELDSYKHSAIPLTGDARAGLEELAAAVGDYHVPPVYSSQVCGHRAAWENEVDRLYTMSSDQGIVQSELVGAMDKFLQPRDIILNAAGSLPGDLHKLWRTRDPKGYHMEYGYSTMGYEIAGGLGAKMADPSREVYVLVGDGSYQMMSSEIATSIQEGVKLNIIILDNHGFSSIGGLSKAVGCEGFGTDYRMRDDGELKGGYVPVDFTANAASWGAIAVRVRSRKEFEQALVEQRGHTRTSVIVAEVEKEIRVPGYESWWDVAIAEVSEMETVKSARKKYEEAVKAERLFL